MNATKLSLLLLSVTLFLVGCSNSEISQVNQLKDKSSSGVIRVDKSSVDIGTVKMSEGKVDTPFAFRNEGDEPVVLLEGVTSCMCTEAVVKSSAGVVSPRIKMPGHGPVVNVFQVLDPGEEAELIVTFDPNAHGPQGTGPIMRDVILQTNSTQTPKVTFRISGNVVR